MLTLLLRQRLFQKEAQPQGLPYRLFDGGNTDMIEKLKREAQDAAAVCDKIGIKHNVLELKDLFKTHVIDYFIDEYIAGRTPNPCIQCNIHIKFGAMLDYAKQNEFDKIATGHYAK